MRCMEFRGDVQLVPGDLLSRQPSNRHWERGYMSAIPSMALDELHRAEKRYEVGRVSGKQEAKQRQLRSILNKLTPSNFEYLFEQVLQVLDAAAVPDFVLQIVGRAIGEPIYCEMYAELCYLINDKLPVYFSSDNKMITVKRSVLNECQKIFERGFMVVEDGTIKLSEDERKDDKIKTHVYAHGGIQFIGELFKKAMIPLKLMHHIIQVLLEGHQNPDEKNTEALCLLMTTAGEMLDDQSKRLMDPYFCRMLELSANQKLSSRVRFMVMNAIDLRNNDWQERRKIERPTKIWDMHLARKRHTQYRPYGFTGNSRIQLDHDVPVPCVQDDFEEVVLIRRYEHTGRTLFQSIPNNIRSSHAKILDPNHPGRPPFGHGSRQHPLSPSNAVETESNLVPSFQKPLFVLHKAKRRYEVGRVFSREDAKQRKLRVILNKLTFQNFDKLLLEVREVDFEHIITLYGFVSQIFYKAISESTYCKVYANFCSYLACELPDFHMNDEKTVTFKRLLLNICQEKFETRDRDQPPVKEARGESIDNRLYDADSKVSGFQGHHQRLGNIQFIGELYRVRLLTEGIMHSCIQALLEGHPSPNDEDIEALCKLMCVIGNKIDHRRAKEHLDAYFDIMEQMSTSQKLSHRIRFLLMDVIDLRQNKWQTIRKTEKPKKLEDAHTIYRNVLNAIDLSSSDDNTVDLGDHFGNSASLDVKIQRKERRVDEDCYILEPDDCRSLATDLEHKVAIGNDSEEDVCIISEKGQVACRDYPHPRHLCAQYPFNSTNHENFCTQCYCYVCDGRAPCDFWEGQLNHCHASDKEQEWIALRAVCRDLKGKFEHS